MAKKKIFISHIGEESEIAKKFKKEILNYTNRGVEIFVSSDDESIYAGDDWEDEVKNNIKSCDMMLVLLSKKSLYRPWISFETGAAWVRGIKPIPICHGGLDTDSLPKPFSIMQALNADEKGLTKVFRRVSLLRDEDFVSADVTELINVIKSFDKKYYEIDEIQEFLSIFDDYAKSVLKNLNEDNDYSAELRMEESCYNQLLDMKNNFEIGKHITLDTGTMLVGLVNNKWTHTIQYRIKIDNQLAEKLKNN
ncbi:TPA: toll/interleukin-1 receptor domain-containing protein [Streptococcus agalactiae]